MNRRLKHLHSAAIAAAVALLVPSAISAAQFKFGFDNYSRSESPGYVYDGLLFVHCCHSHPYPPYDRYCCHGRSGYYAPGRTVARTAVGAAVTYGAYRGVRSATKSAYKKGYNKAKKNIKRRR